MFGAALQERFVEYLIFVLAVYVTAFLLARLIGFGLNRYFKSASRKLRVDPTNYKFFINALNLLVAITATLIIFLFIPELRKLGMTLTAGAGIITVIVGFAAQQALGNIVSGIFIVIYKPIRVGDWVQVGALSSGIVEDINLRHVVIQSWENRRIVIPNSVISSETILNSNLIENETCVFLEMGISYDSDVDKAEEIMRELTLKHPSFIDRRTNEEKAAGRHPVLTRVIALGDSSVNIRLYLWANDPIEGFIMKCDLIKSIKKEWEANGIEIPFPHRTIVFKDGSALGTNP